MKKKHLSQALLASVPLNHMRWLEEWLGSYQSDELMIYHDETAMAIIVESDDPLVLGVLDEFLATGAMGRARRLVELVQQKQKENADGPG